MAAVLSESQITAIYRRMLLIRRFEEAVVENGKEIAGPYRVSIGKEATAVAASTALGPDDYLSSTSRSHGHLLARGADPSLLMAEIFGKTTGSNRGYGGTMHLIDTKLGFVANSNMTAGVIPVISGAALTCQVRGKRQVALGWFGEAALNEGAFYEALNIAALWRLPVVYICENSTEPDAAVTGEPGASASSAAAEIRSSTNPAVATSPIPSSFGIPVVRVDGANTAAVYGVVVAAVMRARNGGGPTFIDAPTHPWPGGSGRPDSLPGGKTDLSEAAPSGSRTGAVDPWRSSHDPIIRLTREILLDGVLRVQDVLTVDEEIRGQIEAALEFARASPFPNPEDALRGVFA